VSPGSPPPRTFANVILLGAVIHAYASQGPRSYRAEYHRRVSAALPEPLHDGVVTEADLTHLPDPVISASLPGRV
jgi:hypothetical protein